MPVVSINHDENGTRHVTPQEPITGIFINLFDAQELSTKHENGETIFKVILKDGTRVQFRTTPAGGYTLDTSRDDGNVLTRIDNDYRLFIQQHV